ncbi:MAG: CinA family protein [Sulfitobacter sp.]
MSIAAQILELSIEKGIMIACAESCTGGMLAASLTDLPGSSVMFERGFVTYTNAAKMDMLDVRDTTLQEFGAVSEQVAHEMAAGALAGSAAQIALSITGIAGPGGSEHKPEGRVCFGIATARGILTQTQEFGALGRAAVRCAARDHALEMILASLHNLPGD